MLLLEISLRPFGTVLSHRATCPRVIRHLYQELIPLYVQGHTAHTFAGKSRWEATIHSVTKEDHGSFQQTPELVSALQNRYRAGCRLRDVLRNSDYCNRTLENLALQYNRVAPPRV